MSSARVMLALGVAAASLATHAGAEEDILDPDLLTPAESEARELERRRNARPSLSVSPRSLRAGLKKTEKATLRLTVRNAGGKTLSWRVIRSPGWAGIEPDRGELGFRQSQEVTVTLDAARLAPGTSTGRLLVEALNATGSPAAVDFVVRVEAPPEPRRPTPPVEHVEPPAPKPPRDEPPPRRPEPSRLSTDRRGGLGVRAGAVLPASGSAADYGVKARMGVFYRRGILEIGIDMGTADEAGGYSSTPFGTKLDAVFEMGAAYLLAGGAVVLEFVDDSRDDASYTNGAFGLDLGFGVSFTEGRGDVRIVYQILLGSDNVGGQPVLTAGWRF